jgi:RNA polymerase sigma-70 factor (ECF subfamily)
MRKATPIPKDEMLMAQLWNRFKAGDREAFNQLTRARYWLLFNYGTHFTRDRHLIKDCVQDLFLELWHRRKTIAETPYVTIYLVKALRYNLLRKLRREQSWRFAEEETFELEIGFTDGVTAEVEWIAGETIKEANHTIRQAVELLPKRQQEVVFLKFYEGLSNDDIARAMAVEKQTVANFLYRAMTQLRSQLPAHMVSGSQSVL